VALYAYSWPALSKSEGLVGASPVKGH